MLLNGLVVWFSVSKRRYCLLTKSIKTTKIILYCATLACVFGLIPLFFIPASSVQPSPVLFSSSVCQQTARRKPKLYHKDENCILKTLWRLSLHDHNARWVRNMNASLSQVALTKPRSLWILCDATIPCFIHFWRKVPLEYAYQTLSSSPQSQSLACSQITWHFFLHVCSNFVCIKQLPGVNRGLEEELSCLGFNSQGF